MPERQRESCLSTRGFYEKQEQQTGSKAKYRGEQNTEPGCVTEGMRIPEAIGRGEKVHYQQNHSGRYCACHVWQNENETLGDPTNGTVIKNSGILPCLLPER